jgi:hypothetical protein
MDNEETRTRPEGAEREGDVSTFGGGDEAAPEEVVGGTSTGGGIDGIGAATGPALGALHPPKEKPASHDTAKDQRHGHAVEGTSGSTPADLGGGVAGQGAYNPGGGAPNPPKGRLEGQ